jgi:twitching motility two-component system response regulator PilH
MAVSKILVVDDSLTDLTKMKDILTQGGYLVSTAGSGEEALRKAHSERPDVIFLDVVMEDKNGFQTCRELKKDEATKNISVFMVSSKSQKVDHIYAQQVGAKELIPKPVDAEAVLSRLRGL